MVDQIQTAGKAVWTAAVVGLAATAPKYIQWGTGTAAAISANTVTTPAAPTTTTAVTGTIAQGTTTTTNDSAVVTGTVTAGGALSITEVGTTTNATVASGTMTQYHDFAAVALVSGDSIAFTITTKLS